MHYFRLQKKITRIIICSGKQALNQNKFHPPSKQPIAAHLPPFLNRPNRAARGPRHPDQPHAARQPTGLLCRCLKANRLGTGTQKDSGWNCTRRGRGEGKGKRTGTRGTTTLCVCLMHLWVYPVPFSALISRFAPPPTRPARAEFKARRNMHYEWWNGSWTSSEVRERSKTITLFQWGRRKTAYLQGLNAWSMPNRGPGECSCALRLRLLCKLCPFYSSNSKWRHMPSERPRRARTELVLWPKPSRRTQKLPLTLTGLSMCCDPPSSIHCLSTQSISTLLFP